MPIQTIFPSYLYSDKLTKNTRALKALNKELHIEVEQVHKYDKQGLEWSLDNYPNGYTSYASSTEGFDKMHLFSSTFEQLEKLIRPHVKKYAKHLEMDLKDRQLVMSNMWVNIMPPGTQHAMHIHPLSTISGTYYLNTPKNCSSIKFEDPRMVFFMASPPRKINARAENQRYIHFQPQSGQVILFESWMNHEVPKNKTKDPRISISFNYDWI